MKKRMLILAICLAIALVLCLILLLLPKSPDGGQIQLPLPTWKPRPTTSDTTTTTDVPPEPGEIRLYACEKENLADYEALAQRYSARSGLTVTVVTGDLSQLMESPDAPTLFCLHSQESAAQWSDRLFDLGGAAVLDALYSDAFALDMEGKKVAISMDVAAYGLVYNAALLGKAGFTRSDLTNFASLSSVAQHITEDRKILNFYPFSTPNLENPDFLRYLVGISQNPEQIRGFIELYTKNATASGDPLAQFLAEKTVFYVASGWDYDAFSSLGIHKLDILPIFTPDGGGFHCISSTYWGVNAQAAEPDRLATLDFLNWVVTAEENGAAPVDSLGWFAPFVDAAGAQNAFQKLLRKYIATEPVTVRWEIAPGMTEEKLQDVAQALATYLANPTEDTWNKVAALLTE